LELELEPELEPVRDVVVSSDPSPVLDEESVAVVGVEVVLVGDDVVVGSLVGAVIVDNGSVVVVVVVADVELSSLSIATTSSAGQPTRALEDNSTMDNCGRRSMLFIGVPDSPLDYGHNLDVSRRARHPLKYVYVDVYRRPVHCVSGTRCEDFGRGSY
ncbi:MAG: hypothetical protein KUG77_06550, partial [Nannocystaceae bacterium]|nr:hypothetical protein [Nannocystaceae bacterium]